MKWWNDLWLNESFATVMAYTCCEITKSTPAFKEMADNAWLYFSDEVSWGLRDDVLSSNHSIDAPCENNDDAENLIDGITYGKGAAVLRQLIYFVG